jgi:hypothetical protein
LNPQTFNPFHLLDLNYRLPRNLPGFSISTASPSFI